MASRAYPGLGLRGDWALGEDNYKDEMDGNLLWLSVLVHGRFIDQVTAEPGAPTEGDIYILSAAHATHPNEIAVYDEAGWHYRAPAAGWRLFNTTLGIFSQFSGTAWVNDTAGLDAENVRDIMAAALTSGTNITVVPDDALDTITLNAIGDGTGLTAEQVMDTIAAMMLPGSNVTLTYNDVADTLTVASASVTLLRPINFQVLTSGPAASEVLGLYPAADAFTLPANLAGSVASILSNPTASFAIDVQRQVGGAGGFTSIGTITVSTGGVVTWATAGGTSKAIAAGDVLKFVGDADGDATFLGAFTVKGII